MFTDSARYPTAVFLSASVKASPASPPIIVFSVPVVSDSAALCPTATLKDSVAVPWSCVFNAFTPTATFLADKNRIEKDNKISFGVVPFIVSGNTYEPSKVYYNAELDKFQIFNGSQVDPPFEDIDITR